MKIIKIHSFVIETYLPIEPGEDLTKVTIFDDQPVKGLKYAWHWYAGLGIAPGTGTKGCPPIPGSVWSPYFEDAEVFNDKDKAIECHKNVLGGDINMHVIEFKDSHYAQSWKIKN